MLTVDQAMDKRLTAMEKYLDASSVIQFPYKKNDIQIIHDRISEVIQVFTDTSNIIPFDAEVSSFLKDLKIKLEKFEEDIKHPAFS